MRVRMKSPTTACPQSFAPMFILIALGLPLTDVQAQAVTIKDGAYHFQVSLPPALQKCKEKAKPVGTEGLLGVCENTEGWGERLGKFFSSDPNRVINVVIYDSTGEVQWPSLRRSASWKTAASALGEAAPFGKRFFQVMPIEDGFYHVFFNPRDDLNFWSSRLTIPHPQPDSLPDSLKTPQFQQCKEKAKPVGKEGFLGVCERSESGLEVTHTVIYDSTDEIMLAYHDHSETWKKTADSLEAPFGLAGIASVKSLGGHYYSVDFQVTLNPDF